MGDVIYLNNFSPEQGGQAPTIEVSGPEPDRDVEKCVIIRDHIEEIMDMISAVHRDPETVALAASRYGSMRLYQLQGRARTMAFISRCIETAEITEDIQGK